MKKYIVKFFERSPFDKSDYIVDVQVLCDIETGEPFAHLDSPFDWVGKEISEDQLECEWNSKKSKYLVVDDEVQFGKIKTLFGRIKSIDKSDKDLDEDQINLIDCFDSFSKIDNLNEIAQKIEPIQTLQRRELQHKSYIFAKIKNDDINWEKIEQEWIDFTDGYAPGNDEVLNWWKERVDPKK